MDNNIPYQPPVPQNAQTSSSNNFEVPKRKSVFPSLLASALVGGLLAGGAVYAMLSNQNKELSMKYDELQNEVQNLKTEPTSTPTTVPLKMTTGTATSLKEYKHPYIPGLSFFYDSKKWNLKEDNARRNFRTINLTSTNNSKIAIYYFFVTDYGGGPVWLPYKKQDFLKVGNLYRYSKNILDNSDRLHDIYSPYFYIINPPTPFTEVSRKAAYNTCTERNMGNCILYLDETYTHYLGSFFTAKSSVKTSETVDKLFPNEIKEIYLPQASEMKQVSFYVEYFGNNPLEADEIIKQIKVQKVQ